MLNFIKAVLYGVIEGITEWLPISSTGHMILAEQFLQFDLSDEFLSMFRVVIQLGAILAVVVLYWKQLWPFTRNNHKNTGAARYIKWPIFRLWCKILVASLPAAVLGLLLDDWMDAHLYTPLVVGIMLIFYGVVFLVVENRREAIRWAMDHAQAGDIIVLAGKGHETYQIIGTEKTHLDEREEVAHHLATKE